MTLPAGAAAMAVSLFVFLLVPGLAHAETGADLTNVIAVLFSFLEAPVASVSLWILGVSASVAVLAGFIFIRAWIIAKRTTAPKIGMEMLEHFRINPLLKLGRLSVLPSIILWISGTDSFKATFVLRLKGLSQSWLGALRWYLLDRNGQIVLYIDEIFENEAIREIPDGPIKEEYLQWVVLAVDSLCEAAASHGIQRAYALTPEEYYKKQDIEKDGEIDKIYTSPYQEGWRKEMGSLYDGVTLWVRDLKRIDIAGFPASIWNARSGLPPEEDATAKERILAKNDRDATIFVNFDFALRAPPEQLLIVIAHELLHIIFPQRSEKEIQLQQSVDHAKASRGAIITAAIGLVLFVLAPGVAHAETALQGVVDTFFANRWLALAVLCLPCMVVKIGMAFFSKQVTVDLNHIEYKSLKSSIWKIYEFGRMQAHLHLMNVLVIALSVFLYQSGIAILAVLSALIACIHFACFLPSAPAEAGFAESLYRRGLIYDIFWLSFVNGFSVFIQAFVFSLYFYYIWHDHQYFKSALLPRLPNFINKQPYAAVQVTDVSLRFWEHYPKWLAWLGPFVPLFPLYITPRQAFIPWPASASIRPGQEAPAEEEFDFALRGLNAKNLVDVKGVNVASALDALKSIGGYWKDISLEELLGSVCVRAPTPGLLAANAVLKNIFEKVFGFVCFDRDNKPVIFIAPDVSNNFQELVLTLGHCVAEARGGHPISLMGQMDAVQKFSHEPPVADGFKYVGTFFIALNSVLWLRQVELYRERTGRSLSGYDRREFLLHHQVARREDGQVVWSPLLDQQDPRADIRKIFKGLGSIKNLYSEGLPLLAGEISTQVKNPPDSHMVGLLLSFFDLSGFSRIVLIHGASRNLVTVISSQTNPDTQELIISYSREKPMRGDEAFYKLQQQLLPLSRMTTQDDLQAALAPNPLISQRYEEALLVLISIIPGLRWNFNSRRIFL